MTSTARPSTTASKATSSTSTSTSTATPDPDSFVGSTVRVVMTSGIVATGTVAHVNPGSSSAALTLHNVSASFNGSTTVVAAVDIPGATIKDLTIIKAAAAVAIAAAASSQPPLRSSPADPTPPAATPFIDPAILSFTPVAAIPPPPIPSILQRHAPVSSPNASAHPAPTRQFTIPTPTSSTNGSHRPRPPIETCEEDGSTSSSSSSSSSSNNDAHARRLRISASNGSGAAKHQHHNGHAMSPKQSSSQLNHTNNNNNNKNNKHKRNHHSQYRNGPRSQQQHQHHQQQQDTWDLGDVSDYHAHEFDFQAGLRRFDKQSVFDEIRKTDTVAPEDRLVSINRRAPPTIAKLKHTEMVLDPTTSPSPSPSPSSSSTRRRPSLASAGAAALTLPLAAPSAPSARLRTLFGVPLPSATPLQTLDALRICGLPDLVLTENAGRSIAMMVLQALGGNRRFATCNLNGPPHVVLLCGRNRAGDMTRVAGRHLRTRGVVCSVVQVGKHQERHMCMRLRWKCPQRWRWI
ncbi:hypothetical protein BCR44DRAFT_1173125 [Catenaria anguillulae PL171]|uniref:YjeF N-terminal domain-containing protein n=1 Tax=Catenaria anguillulae PL171 TaxID=765915 RepID=A0A1Y2I0H7_9FUNG|nr:hypothetical protein BCR44DRAFT_1173125 [Catenaria anguillulae PL171]